MSDFAFITDITSTEGNLQTFSAICAILDLNKYSFSQFLPRIVHVIQSESSKVVSRHLRIMEKLSIIEKKGNVYTLSAEGRAFFDLLPKEQLVRNSLTDYEKVFFFRWLFSRYYPQIAYFLEALSEFPQERKILILKYFSKILESPVKSWRKETIEKSLGILREGKISSFFANKFGCVEGWIKHLGIVKNTVLTLEGNRLVNKLTDEGFLPFSNETLKMVNKMKENLHLLASTLLRKRTTECFNHENTEHVSLFRSLFMESLPRFSVEPKMTNLGSIRSWVCCKFLVDHGVILEYTHVNTLVEELWREGVIRSVMSDQTGRPTYVTWD